MSRQFATDVTTIYDIFCHPSPSSRPLLDFKPAKATLKISPGRWGETTQNTTKAGVSDTPPLNLGRGVSAALSFVLSRSFSLSLSLSFVLSLSLSRSFVLSLSLSRSFSLSLSLYRSFSFSLSLSLVSFVRLSLSLFLVRSLSLSLSLS